ncbi:MAG: exodeoxyribonuclease V subunit alpha [Burkholderiaceae bacterium]|nr:exodeoxyribonuclease V subunit alpha [Burkholderiaceae bacterium]
MNPPRTLATDPHSQSLLAVFGLWAERGVLRRLDVALARFIAELCPQVTPQVLMAVVVLADLEGRGHTCVLLEDLPQHIAALQERAARAAAPPVLQANFTNWEDGLRALRACSAVFEEGTKPDSGAPLVLNAMRLYLRRYWDYESRVAAAVQQRLLPQTPVDVEVAAAALSQLFAAGQENPQTAGPSQIALTPTVNAPPAEVAPDWQKLACALALRGRLAILTGGPGTGKTYTAARLLALLFATAAHPAGLRVALAAPTGKAAARLKQSIDQALQTLPAIPGVPDLSQRIGAARTLHSLLGARPDTRRFARNAAHPLEVDVLLIDEASMVHLEMMAAILDALPPAARLILLGDKDQLASVEAGAVLGELCADADGGHYQPETARALAQISGQHIPPSMIDSQENAGSPQVFLTPTGGGSASRPRGRSKGSALAQHVVMLRQSRRFGGSIGQLASAVHAGDADKAMDLLRDPLDAAVRQLPSTLQLAEDLVHLAVNGRDQAHGYAHYAELLQHNPPASAQSAAWNDWARSVLTAFDQCRVLCAVREGPWGLHALNTAIAERLDALGLLRGRGDWYAGRPVMVTRNDHDLGVLNGDVGMVLPTPKDGLRVVFVNGPMLRSVSISRLTDVQTAFAMTVHQSQGSEFAHTVLVLPERSAAISRELIYTGLTRARSAFTLACADAQTLREGILRVTRRSSGLLARIDTLPTP